MAQPLKTASVEILEGVHNFVCDTEIACSSKALFNVFDGMSPLYACGYHLARAVKRVATRKGN